MVKVKFYYDLDDDYREGPESFHIKVNGFELTAELSDEEAKQPLNDLYTKYKRIAITNALLKYVIE